MNLTSFRTLFFTLSLFVIPAPAQLVISEFMASNTTTLADENGDFSDWVEVTNIGTETVNLENWLLVNQSDFSLSDPDSYWAFPSRNLAEGESLVVFASSKDRRPPGNAELHTNFKLSKGGEYLALVTPDGVSVVTEFSPMYPQQRSDISYGLSEGEEVFFTDPTPEMPNGQGILGFVGDTKFSKDRGFYEAPFELLITSDTVDATIIYTLDGSTPSMANGVQSQGMATVMISETTPVRAGAFKDGFRASNIDTQTYLFLEDIITQEAFPAGYPTTWRGDGGNGSFPADYGMDSEVTQSAAYQDLIDNALTAVPTISIVTDKENLFDPASGIYQNPQQSGSAWERPTSVEFIRPDGSVKNIQLNAGIRIQGGHTRLPSKNPKHSFRLSFKDEFGPKSLNYQLFPEDDFATQKFDQLILRGAGNQSWLHHNTFLGDNRGRAQYIRDQWAKDTQIAMNGIGARSLYAHLYINGIYWGLYNPTERVTAGFGESYLGGDKDDYQALNSGEAIDGQNTRSDYLDMIALANSGLSDPTKYSELKELLDIEAFTDYMILNQYGGNLDWDFHNWYALRNKNGGKWHFMCWDSEFFFISPNDNVLAVENSDDPTGIWMDLLENEEYRLFFADRVQKHLANDGLLTPGPVLERWEARKDQMFDAIVAESARWGDYRRDVHPFGTPTPIPLYDRDEEWAAERNRLLTQYFPVRTSRVLQQYRSAGYLPSTEAPVFDLAGGLILPDSPLEISSPDGGDVYYTLDGSDPRVPAEVRTFALIEEGAPMKVFVPIDDDLNPIWRGGSEPFDDSAWLTGAAAGFERNSPGDYTELFDIDLKSEMSGRSPSCYVRMTFDIPDQETLDVITGLTLGVRYDDGFAAFINGDRVTSANVLDPLTWNGAIVTSHPDALAKVYQPFVLPQSALQSLQVGQNILAIHAFNTNMNSSDFLIDAILSVTTSTSEALSPSALLYNGAISVTDATTVNARVMNGNDWSALTSSTYFTATPASIGNLVISEVMFHPADTSTAEFLEFQNISSEVIDLTGVFFSEGVQFTFPFGTTLPASGRILLVRELSVFESIYGEDLPVIGVFENGTALDDSGERLTLKARDGSLIQSFKFDDTASWPALADGGGASLVLRKPFTNPNPDVSSSWRASVATGGNPAADDAISFSGVATADEDGDGLTALMEYALGTSDQDQSEGRDSLQILQEFGMPVILMREAAGADDAVLRLEFSSDLRGWDTYEAGEGTSQQVLSNGILESRYHLTGNSSGPYFRLKVELR